VKWLYTGGELESDCTMKVEVKVKVIIQWKWMWLYNESERESDYTKEVTVKVKVVM
jgi:hypothetical protein